MDEKLLVDLKREDYCDRNRFLFITMLLTGCSGHKSFIIRQVV